MRKSAFIVSLTAFALLAGCGTRDDRGEGTSISINANEADGETIKASSDGKTGKVAVDLPGFKAEVDLPKIHLDADDFDMNGAQLYPGSKISALTITGDKNEQGKSDGMVKVTFDAPADVATVRSWFADRLVRDGGFKVTESPNGLSGITDEAKPFTLTLTPAGAGHTAGIMAISGG